MCYSIFEKNFSYLSWLSLLLILESWVLNLDLDSWDLEPWILILDSKLSFWVLNSSWFLSWTLELFLIHLSGSLIHLWFTWVVLWLMFELFVITFVIIFCYHQNTFESPLILHEALLLQSPPFWWWQLLKSRNTHTHTFS